MIKGRIQDYWPLPIMIMGLVLLMGLNEGIKSFQPVQIKGVTMADKKVNLAFRHEREWPVLLKVARQYDLSPRETLFLLAIRNVENGPPGNEFGVAYLKGTNLETQAGGAAESIKNNTQRYNKLMTEGSYQGTRRLVIRGDLKGKSNIQAPHTYIDPNLDYIDFFHRYAKSGYGWAPIDAPEMPKKERELNANWGNNMRSTLGKLQKHFEDKGISLTYE